MGNQPSLILDDKSLLNLETNYIFDELFVRNEYRSSPLRTVPQQFKEDINEFSKNRINFEKYYHLFGENIGLFQYIRALASSSPSLPSFYQLDHMRAELLQRLNFQIRKQLEETVSISLQLFSFFHILEIILLFL